MTTEDNDEDERERQKEAREEAEDLETEEELRKDQDLRTHEVYVKYRELGIKRRELDVKRDEQGTRTLGLFLQSVAVCAVVLGGYWGMVKFDHQKEVENADRYRQMSQPYREMELSRLVRMVDAAGTVAARYPGDTEDPSYREAIRSFSNDFFSSKVLFLNLRVEDAADDFALAAEHCTGEPIRGMPPQDPKPDGQCSPCIRKLALNLSIAARSQLASEWDQAIEPHLGNDADDCTNWAHEFRIKKK